MKTLRDALLEYPPQMLRAIADMNALQLPEGGSRDQWADFLSNELARADIAQQAWQSLGEAERGIIERMRQNDGRIKAFQLLRDHGEIRPFGVVALARDKPWLSPANSVESLWYRGLIQRAFDVGGAYRGEVFFIPQEILAHWPRAGAGEVHFAIKTVPAPQAILDDDDAAVWDMFTFLSFVVREEPVSADGDMLRPDDLLTLHAQFLVKDDFQDKRAASAAPRLSFIQRIARTARLVKSNDGRGLRAGLRATDWLRAPRHQQRMQLVEAWQRERLWNELAHVPTLRLEETGWKNDPRLARNVVWAQLAHCPTGAWISTASFVAAIKKADPDFQRPDGDYERWHIRDQATGRLLTGFSQWQNVEGALISYILHFPLRWLGVVNVSAKMDEQAEFSITEFGARALGRSAVNPPQPRAAKVIAQANFEVLVPLDAPLNARFQLERMAERVRWPADPRVGDATAAAAGHDRTDDWLPQARVA
ncbi:MAG: hypothetical protein HY259_15435 [Chloroflexi bacterium]|nr:hypothetical protein [Chloroflexota bacterium]